MKKIVKATEDLIESFIEHDEMYRQSQLRYDVCGSCKEYMKALDEAFRR